MAQKIEFEIRLDFGLYTLKKAASSQSHSLRLVNENQPTRKYDIEKYHLEVEKYHILLMTF